MRILLVEDDRMNVELFVDVLEDEDCDVTVEREGIAGRNRALAEHFDVILLDVQLPGLRGDEVCEQLRASGITTPVLALTAQALASQVAQGFASGFDDYLTKPIAPSVLRAAVKRAVLKGGASTT